MIRDVLQLNTFHKRALCTLGIILCLLIASYAFLIKQTVANVVVRRHVENDISELAAEVSMLESDYSDHAKAITPNEAYARGFEERTDVLFVSRNTPSRTVFLSQQ